MGKRSRLISRPRGVRATRGDSACFVPHQIADETAALQARAVVARHVIELVTRVHDKWFPRGTSLVQTLDLVFVCAVVLVGHAEGRLVRPHKIALTLRMPDQTVTRKLAALEKIGAVERRGKAYAFISPRQSNALGMTKNSAWPLPAPMQR